MADRLRLEVVTPSRRVLELEADEVRIPGAEGELGVLPGHTELLTSLSTGELTWFDGGSETGVLVVQGGFAEVLPTRVTVLARVAEAPEEIDLEAARTILMEAQESLKTATADDLEGFSAAVRLAETRIAVSSRS